MLDTFHMNIEEDDLPQAIRLAGALLIHFQANENHRGFLGTGHIDWSQICRGLARSTTKARSHWSRSAAPAIYCRCRWRNGARPAATRMPICEQAAICCAGCCTRHGGNDGPTGSG
jgi:hypothetical protein